MSSAKEWSFPPRPETHHVRSILPDLVKPGRLQVAIEAGALLRSDDAGGTWLDRIPSGPKGTHSLAVHPHDPTRLHSAAGDGYFESVDDGDSWRRIVEGLEHQYCWSIALSIADPTTLLLSASKSAHAAHFKESASSFVYRRTGNEAWRQVRDGLPTAQGLRIPVVAASSVEPGLFYASAEGMIWQSVDDGLKWQKVAVQWIDDAAAEHAIDMAIVELESRDVNCSARRSEIGGDLNQLSEGFGLHLLHDLPTMCFNRDLANAELAANLFIQ